MTSQCLELAFTHIKRVCVCVCVYVCVCVCVYTHEQKVPRGAGRKGENHKILATVGTKVFIVLFFNIFSSCEIFL